MSFIAEDTIEAVAQKLDQDSENYAELIQRFQAQQPELMAYILSEDTSFLTEPERDYLLYLSLIILDSVQSKQALPSNISTDVISQAEDYNWEKIEKVTAKDFRERLNVFFANYPQEDLLAFVEDALIPDEDSPITKEGREPLFIALKTLIDVLTIPKN